MKNKALLERFIKETLDGFGNKLIWKDGTAGNLRFDVPTTGHQRSNIIDDEASEEQHHKRAACVVVTRSDGKILTVSRLDDPNKIGLPGGNVDVAETFKDAAARELREETGLIATKLTFVFRDTDELGYEVVTFAGRVEGDIHTSESGVIKWLDPTDLADDNKSPFAAYNRKLFKQLGRT